jgi:hypothetical protein
MSSQTGPKIPVVGFKANTFPVPVLVPPIKAIAAQEKGID